MKLINKKRWLILGTVTALSAPITMATFLSTGGKTKQFVFDGRVFSNENEALHYLMQYKKAKTGEVSIVGNINKSYANAETGLLNKSLLPNFTADDFSFYYFNAGGGINTDYEMAKNTYYNKGRIRTMYIDGFGNTFLSEAQAKRSMENYKMHQMIPYYNVEYYDNTSKYMNPFNEDDVEDFKNNIKDNIESIVIDNLNKDDPSYDVKVLSDVTNSSSQADEYKIKLNWQNIFEKAITIIRKSKNLGSYDISYTDDSINIEPSQPYTIKSDMDSGWFEINGKNGDNATFTYPYYKNNNEDIMDMVITNHGPVRSYWKNLRTFTKDPIDLSDLIDIVDGGNYTYLRSKNNRSGIESKIEDKKYSIDDKYDEIYNSIKDLFKKEFMKNFNDVVVDEPLSKFTNPSLKKIIVDKIKSEFNQKLNNLYRKSYTSMTQYSLTSMPTFDLDYRITKWYRRTEATINRSDYEFGYNVKGTYSLPEDDSISLSTKNKKLLDAIIKPNNNLKLQIIKDGIPLFDVEASVSDSDGSITTKSIEISSENHTNPDVAEAFKKKNGNDSSYYQYYLNLYNQLYENKQTPSKDKDKSKDAFKIFKKYFEDDKKIGLAPKDPNWLYRENLQIDDKPILMNEIFKMFLTTIFDAYLKYKDNGNNEIFESIKKKIPDPSKILLYKGFGSFDLKSLTPHLSKYILRTINNFNAKISSGIYSSIDKVDPSSYSLATTESNWNNLINLPSKDLPAQILVAYDNNGQQINVGNYLYDNESIMEFNIKLRLDPRRDYEHLSYKGKDELENEVSKIYELDFKNNKLYFDKFSSLKRYLLKYIRDNSYNL